MNNWTIVKLKDIAKHSKGAQINGDDLIEDGAFDYLNGGINPSGKWNESNVNGNTITISEGGNSSGYVNYMTEPFWCGAHCYYLYDVKCNTKFLYYALKSQQDRVMALRSGACMPNIKKNDLAEFGFRYNPNSEIQAKIVAMMDKITVLITSRKNQLEKLDELVKSRFVEWFGDVKNDNYIYETRKLGEVAEVKSSHRVFTTEFVEKGVPFYRGTEIGELSNGIKPENPYRITLEHYYRLACDETKPQIGDLLMPSICNKGQIWMVDTDEPFYYKDGRVLCISPNRTLFNCKFLEHFMRQKTLAEYPKLGSGSTFAEFKIFLLKEIDVILPPIELQTQFAAFVTQIDKSKLAVQKSLEQLETLKKSLMQKYFG